MAWLIFFALVATACASTAVDETANPGEAVEQNDAPQDVETDAEPADSAPSDPHQPLYSSLDLTTPGAAAQELIDAYDDRDFMRAWFIFDRSAQQQFARAMNNLDFSMYRGATFVLPTNLIEGTGEHHPVNDLAFFDRLFADAAELGYLHVDLGGATVASSESSGTEEKVAVVALTLADGSETRLRLTPTETGRWRVGQVAIGGAEFDDSEHVFVDESCGPRRVVVYPGAECPSAEAGASGDQATIQAEIDSLTEEAGDDINKQLAAAQQIQNLVESIQSSSDEDVCAALQGNAIVSAAAATPDLLQRAATLLETTCPGDIDLLGAELGEGDLSYESGSSQRPDTAYTRLDLTSPEAGVVTLGELFRNDAFALVLQSMDAEAQRILVRAVNNLNADRFVNREVFDTWDGIGTGEHQDTVATFFLSLMTEARSTGNFLLDLSGPVEVLDTTPMLWETDGSDDPVEAHVVEATVGSGDTLHFLMLESPGGRWRMRQVATDPTAFSDSANADEIYLIG